MCLENLYFSALSFGREYFRFSQLYIPSANNWTFAISSFPSCILAGKNFFKAGDQPRRNLNLPPICLSSQFQINYSRSLLEFGLLSIIERWDCNLGWKRLYTMNIYNYWKLRWSQWRAQFFWDSFCLSLWFFQAAYRPQRISMRK